VARFDAGTTDIPTAGTRVQINNTTQKVLSLSVKGVPGNTGNVFFGVSDVSSTNGWTLQPNEALYLDFEPGTEVMSNFYADVATSGDDIEWVVVYA
jgi:hypothetical protein